ncbi:hypothetical protein BOX15_Mlig020715g1, partial [Macrostomum lignano]
AVPLVYGVGPGIVALGCLLCLTLLSGLIASRLKSSSAGRQFGLLIGAAALLACAGLLSLPRPAAPAADAATVDFMLIGRASLLCGLAVALLLAGLQEFVLLNSVGGGPDFVPGFN